MRTTGNAAKRTTKRRVEFLVVMKLTVYTRNNVIARNEKIKIKLKNLFL